MAVAIREVETKQTAQQAPALANKHLISDQLWTRLVNRIVKDEKVELAMAERIMDQALGFLALCAQNTGQSFSPSAQVDTGWHTFVLYTREYAQFCQQIAGRFIHHSPSDEEGVNYGTGNIARTVTAMKAAGIQVDDELWLRSDSARCTDDYCTDGNCDNHQ
jgi:hypothetical protein